MPAPTKLSTVAHVHAILTRLIEEAGEAESPVFMEIDGLEVPIRSVSHIMGEPPEKRRVTIRGRT